MLTKLLKEKIEVLGLEDIVRIRSYSGRRMNSKECLGLDCAYICQAIKVMLHVVADMAKNNNIELGCTIDDFSDFHTDSLGRGMIVYFPQISMNCEEENESEEISD